MIDASAPIAIEGCVLTCPRCRARVGTLRKALYQNWNVGLDAIRFEPGMEPDRELPQAHCNQCGASYAELDIRVEHGVRTQQTLLHTDHGWLPRRPAHVPASPRKPILRPAG